MAEEGEKMAFGAAWVEEEIGDQKADSVELFDWEGSLKQICVTSDAKELRGPLLLHPEQWNPEVGED